MNLILLFSIIVSGLQIVPKQADTTNVKCITDKRIMSSIEDWKVIKAEIKQTKNGTMLYINAHNPLNKTTPKSIDASFVAVMLSTEPGSEQRYKLLEANFYNTEENVVLKRVEKDNIYDDCFSREVLPVLNVDAK